ncbi:hypothetical protein B5S31_g1017 [[Candida] boidinii]|nr:hypothetical protein B5S31_g1017 [[Candida] boidinii]
MENNIEIFCELYRLYDYTKGIISTIFFMRSLGKVKPYDGFFLNCAYPKISNYPELESIIDSKITYMINELKSASSQINISTDPKYKYYKCMIMIKFYETTVQIEPQQRSNIIRNYGKQQQQQQVQGLSPSPGIANSEASLNTTTQKYKNNWETWNLKFNIIDTKKHYPINQIFKDFTNYKNEFSKMIFQIVELSNENNKNSPKISDKDKDKDKDKICYFPFRISFTLNSNLTSVDSDDTSTSNDLGNSSSSSIEYVFKTGSGNLIVSNSDPSQRARISGGSSGATATSVTTTGGRQTERGKNTNDDKQNGNGGGYTGEEIIRNGLNFIKKTVLGDQ